MSEPYVRYMLRFGSQEPIPEMGFFETYEEDGVILQSLTLVNRHDRNAINSFKKVKRIRPICGPLAALHQACVHMARADYGGDGKATTREGTTIYWCDRFGVHPCSKDAPFAFEAAWGRDGAICVARPRIAEMVSLAQLAERYPKLRSHLGSTKCS